jgi:hypothetical protein
MSEIDELERFRRRHATMKKRTRKETLEHLSVELDFMERAIKDDDPRAELLVRIQMMREHIAKAR